MSLRLNNRLDSQPGGHRRWVLPGHPRWERRYSLSLVVVDVFALMLASIIAQFIRFGFVDQFLRVGTESVAYPTVAGIMVATWLGVIATSGGYSPRVVGAGSDEFRCMSNAAVRFLALAAVLFYLTGLEVARGFVASFVPVAAVLTMVGRYAARRWLHRRRALGDHLHRVVVVGTVEAATELASHLQRASYAGYLVVGACIPPHVESLRVGDDRIPVVGVPGEDTVNVLAACDADVLAIAGDSALPSGSLRTLAWELEGTGIDLVVAPAVTDVAGPRIAIRPVAGVPLLHVEEPQLSGPARVFKECFDRTVAALALIMLSPVFGAIALAVRMTSSGPALFRQERVGRNGQTFTILKFRTMVAEAEAELGDLTHLNEHDGPLFKLRDDPRRTRVGVWLRRFSLDELPQFIHVVTGQMSLVGPRPPLPSEVEKYAEDVRRRLLVKPGLTGLWQVSGRSTLAWEESVRLDLYYVDNWSPALDFLILWKTVNAVLRGHGAY